MLIFTACDGYAYFYEIETARLINKIALKGPSLVKPIIDGEYIYDPLPKPEPAEPEAELSVWDELDAAYQEGVDSV